jgi:pyruvate dehydrogenase E1 component alpha subunit
MSIDNIADRAASYGIPGEAVDGMDIEAVYDAADRLIKRAREGKGPALLECKTYRFRGHSRFEPASYRPKGEAEEWKKKDPLLSWAQVLKERFSVTDEILNDIKKAAAKEMDDAVEFSENSPDPDPQDYKNYIFA